LPALGQLEHYREALLVAAGPEAVQNLETVFQGPAARVTSEAKQSGDVVLDQAEQEESEITLTVKVWI
jgi:hypothetical protein